MSDTQEPNTQLCPSCNKYITNSSYQLHTLHCARQYTKCKQCNTSILKTELDDHMLTHSTTTCPLCHTTLPYTELSHHELNCPQRITLCSYCNNAYTAATIQQHEEQCAETTIECDQCHQQVKRNDIAHLLDSCKVMCPQCNKPVLYHELEQHELIDCDARKINCEYCEDEIKLSDYTEHQEQCGNRTERCPDCSRYIKYIDLHEHRNTQCQYPIEVNTNTATSSTTRTDAPLDVFAPMRQRGERLQHVNALRATMNSLHESGETVDDDTLLAIMESMKADDNDRPLRDDYRRSNNTSASSNRPSSTTRSNTASTLHSRNNTNNDYIDLTQLNGNIIYQPPPPRTARPPHLRPSTSTSTSTTTTATSTPTSATLQRRQSVPGPALPTVPPPQHRVRNSTDGGDIYDTINTTDQNIYPCKYCKTPCYDEESLTLHMLTDCYDNYIADPANKPVSTSNTYGALNDDIDNNTSTNNKTNVAAPKPINRRAPSLHSELFDVNELKQYRSQVSPNSGSPSINGKQIQSQNR